MGKQLAVLTGVSLADIHGSRFYDLEFELENGRRGSGRLGAESVYTEPKVGDKIEVSLLLGQLMRAEKVA